MMDGVLFSKLISSRAEKYGDREALRYKDYAAGAWRPISWNLFAEKVDTCANALVEYNVKEHDKLGIFSQNMPECLFADFGAYSNRAVMVPIYATSSPAQVAYIANDAQLKILFVGEQQQYDTLAQCIDSCLSIETVVVFDPDTRISTNDKRFVRMADFMRRGQTKPHADTVAKRRDEAAPSDLINILYTSGTTGEPKGVTLYQYNFTQAIANHYIRLPYMTDKDVSMNFLPMTHIFERAWVYLCLCKGVTVCVNRIPTDIQTSIKEVRPTLMCSVPRFWEKVYAGVQEKISETKGLKKLLMLNAIKTGYEHNIRCMQEKRKPSAWLRIKYRFYEKTVFSLLKRTIGIENGNFFPTAGAAVPDKIFEFCRSVGIRLIIGYGLTESTATVSFTKIDDFIVGSVGDILPNLQVKIDNNGEILIKGDSVTPGYYNKPEENAKAFTSDGWFRTGDAGRKEGNTLYITDRIKDLFKTSNGKYIAPQAIETALVVDKYIDQICIVADKRKYVSALIVPDYKNITDYANRHGIKFDRMEDLVVNPAIIEMIGRRIDALQKDFAQFEHIKKFTLLPHPFSMSKGELTNTLKIKRKIVYSNYAQAIDNMYA